MRSPQPEPTVLAVDIGGTTTSLALASMEPGAAFVRRADYSSREHGSLDSILDDFLGACEAHPSASCIGAAGPVRDGHCSLTNLPWRVDQEQLARRLGCPVQLVNDLVALADGVPDLRAEDQVEIQPGGARTDRAGLLIAVGTGLGVSILTPLTDGTRTALPSEGGHVELAARDALEARVVETMRNRRGGRCDAEALLSGSGLPDLYECLLPESIALGCLESEAITRSVRAGGAAALFTAATSGDGLANFVVERWLSWLGAQIGDYALTALPLGGIYLAGGVLRKNVEWLRRPGFRAGFLAKAHFRDQLAGIPIRIITSPDAALCGAARRARRLATTSPVVPGEPA